MTETFVTEIIQGINYSKAPPDYLDKDPTRARFESEKGSTRRYSPDDIRMLKKEYSNLAEEPYSITSPILFRTGATSQRFQSGQRTIEKIVLENRGEIEFIVKGRRLDIYSRSYRNGKPETRVHITKNLAPQYTPMQILDNATLGIRKRIAQIEMINRMREAYVGIANYQRREIINRLRKIKAEGGHIDAITMKRVNDIVSRAESESWKAA